MRQKVLKAALLLPLIFASAPAFSQSSEETELNDLLKKQSEQAEKLGLTGGNGSPGLNAGSLGELGNQLKNMGSGDSGSGMDLSGAANSIPGLGNLGGSGNFGSNLTPPKAPDSGNSLPAGSAEAGGLPAMPDLGGLDGLLNQAPDSTKIMQQNTDTVKQLLGAP